MTGWTIAKTETSVTVSRLDPARFDVRVEAKFELRQISRTRLARQIRQDMWRALQKVRGFSPAVTVSIEPTVICVTAGGALLSGSSGRARIQGLIRALLDNGDNRARWLNHARTGC